MKWIFLILGLATAAPLLAAPTNSTRTAAERYLFIVDTSASMKTLARETRQSLFDFVYWGLDGHMQPGDTYGIWTVDDDVHTGEFPMTVWKAEQQVDLATKASLFLKDHRYRKEPNFGKLSVGLLSVVMNIKDVNIFLITDGQTPFVGIPLDQQIRDACTARAKERVAANRPFVIYLSARQGEIQSATVAVAGENFKLTPRAPSSTAPRQRSAQPTSIVGAKKPAGRVVSLGYVDPEGNESDGTRQPASTPSAVANSSADQGADELKPTPRAVTKTPPRTGETGEANAVLKSELARAAAIPKKEAAAVVKKEIAQANLAPKPSAPPPAPTQPTPTTTPVETAPSTANAIAAENTTSAPAPSPGPLPIAARERPQPATLATAAPVPPEPVLTSRQLFAVAGVLLLVVIGLFISFIRRLPRPASGSYISKSMDHRS